MSGTYREGLETTPERRALMRRVRRSNTKPEQAVRRILTDLGVSYRLNVKDLPGSPDIANKSARKAIFVHGCFWHFHEACPRGRLPKRNREFWRQKLAANRERDQRKIEALEAQEFDTCVVWECQLDDPQLPATLKEYWERDGVE
jgi:DNA mismatch endonuclease (patch repair protein)